MRDSPAHAARTKVHIKRRRRERIRDRKTYYIRSASSLGYPSPMPPPNLLPHALGQPSLVQPQNASHPYRAAARCSASSRPATRRQWEEVGAGGTHIEAQEGRGSLDERYHRLSVELSFLLEMRYSRLVLGGVEMGARGCTWGR